jgi:hypothetical protein
VFVELASVTVKRSRSFWNISIFSRVGRVMLVNTRGKEMRVLDVDAFWKTLEFMRVNGSWVIQKSSFGILKRCGRWNIFANAIGTIWLQKFNEPIEIMFATKMNVLGVFKWHTGIGVPFESIFNFGTMGTKYITKRRSAAASVC